MLVRSKRIPVKYIFALIAGFWFFLPGVYATDAADTLKIDSLFDTAFELEAHYPDSAIALYEQSGTWAKEINNPLREGQSHHYRAIVMFELGEYDLALASYNRAMELYNEAGNEIGIASVQVNLGNIWLLTGDYDKAVDLYFQGIETFKSQGDTLRLLISYLNIGTLFYDNNYPDESLSYLHNALLLAEHFQDDRTLAEVHHNISLNHYKLDSLDAYLHHMRTARNFAISSGHLYIEMLSYKSNLHYHNDLHNVDSALHYARLNIDAAERYGNPYNLTGVCNAVGYAFMLADQPDSALLYLNKALTLAQTHGYLPMLVQAKQYLSEIHSTLGNYPQAHHYSRSRHHLRDTIFDMEKQKELLAMDRKYKVAQKQNELDQQQLSLELKDKEIRRKNVLVASAGIFALLAVVVIFLLYKLMKNKSRLADREMEKVKLQRDKHMMKALMEGEEKERRRIARELHDGVNGNLAALKLNLAGMQNKEFSSLLEQTMSEIRDLSHNLVPDVVKRSGLKNALEQFVHKINNSPDIKVDFQFMGADDSIAEETGVHMYRIVQELLSNSMKHAEASNVLVQIIINEDSLSLTVEDDGKGFEINPDAGLPKDSEGIGLSGVENRITYLQGSFDIHSSTHTGTSIHIEIPVNTNVLS